MVYIEVLNLLNSRYEGYIRLLNISSILLFDKCIVIVYKVGYRKRGRYPSKTYFFCHRVTTYNTDKFAFPTATTDKTVVCNAGLSDLQNHKL